MEEHETEVELESFRQRWRAEVSARSKKQGNTSRTEEKPGPSGPGRPPKRALLLAQSSQHTRRNDTNDYEPRTFHEIDDKEIALQLGNEAVRPRAKADNLEPQTALEHYEKAVERETQGSLGDSVSLYRKAFKVCFKPTSTSS